VITVELAETGNALAKAASPPIRDRLMDGLKRLYIEGIRQIVVGLRLPSLIF